MHGKCTLRVLIYILIRHFSLPVPIYWQTVTRFLTLKQGGHTFLWNAATTRPMILSSQKTWIPKYNTVRIQYFAKYYPFTNGLTFFNPFGGLSSRMCEMMNNYLFEKCRGYFNWNKLMWKSVQPVGLSHVYVCENYWFAVFCGILLTYLSHFYPGTLCSKSHIHSYGGQSFWHGGTSSHSCNIMLFYTLD
jgi:hypothetical protein